MKTPTVIDDPTVIENPMGVVDEFFGVLEPLQVITINLFFKKLNII
jgi:hypothetical protein